MASQKPVPGCTQHPGSGFIYVCKSCEDQLLCMDCVIESHNGHKLGKLTDYVAEQKREIQQYVDKLSKTEIPKIEEDICENETNGKGYQKIIRDIKRQGKRMKDSIDNVTDLLVKICTELENLNTSISEKNKTALTKHLREDLKPKLNRYQQVLISGTNVDVTTSAREIRNTSIDPPSLEKMQTVEFKSGTISSEVLERMRGKILVDGENQSYITMPKPVILSEFMSSFLFSTCRTCLTGDEAWLSYWDSEKVYRVDLKGNVKEKVECNFKVKPISVSPATGTVWFCVFGDRSIREITTGGDIAKRFNVNNTPYSLSITGDDTVVVGMEAGIQLYTTDGRAVSAGAGSPCRQFAVSLNNMASCSLTGDVAAVDNIGVGYDEYMAGKEPDKQPHVIVMDKHLNLKFRCEEIGTTKSSGNYNESSKFYPVDVCFDGAGDVLVAEWVTKSVLLIDGNNGRCMRTVYTSDESEPYCISLHEDGTFWIGHADCRIKILKYK